MDVLHSDIRELWLVQSRDCAQEPLALDDEHARFLRAVHAGHGAHCRQYLAAVAHSACRAARR
ncbi:hypothetical protein [Nocardia bovistercoris]|uniref:Uncharacterized protein n=1 Tax=Nocardia bovistercoris TaxID=2785916 RepID=A0A931II01_9NOCA|nr:hypothetical protein [Nocardia bovistercoris]MBH0780943.1 hypothetical protein [Nocardia bovistercoris]